MATAVPPSLRSADVGRFAMRAQQLEKAKPVVAYWCDYWVANQILSKGLHSADDAALKYTTDLMDKLEKTKQDNVGNDAILDDVAGKAYVEQFGLETFQRAENAVHANKVTRQTADTFQASATFLDLLQIWGQLDPEIAAKIKYAKYHALRIAKALKAGEDPNLSNPKQPTEEKSDLPALDANDPEVQMLNGAASTPAAGPHQAFVEEVPDENDRLQRTLAPQSTLNESIHPSRASSVPRPPGQTVPPHPSTTDEGFYTSAPPQPDVSPLDPPHVARQGSAGGGYFPQVPNAISTNHSLSSAPPDVSPESPPEEIPSFNDQPPAAPQAPPSKFASFDIPSPPSPPVFSTQPATAPHPDLRNAPPTYPTPPTFSAPPPQVLQPRAAQPLAPQTQRYTARPPQPPAPPVIPVEVDEEAMMKAQKHARWAISALNFEDVPTAIREFREALQTLGGA